MAIQYKNQPFDLTTDVLTTVLTMDVSSRAILQNIQTENISTGTVTVTSAVFDASGSATTQMGTIQMSTLTTQNIAKGPVVLVKNKRTGKVYASKAEFDADVADSNTDTKAEDFRQDLEITVASLEVFGKTN